jgi:PLP dependent protein
MLPSTLTVSPPPAPPEPADALPHRLSEIRRRIGAAAAEAGRAADSVTLVAVSKMQPPERIDAALDAGLRIFGENRVQEAAGRWETRRGDHSDLTLHLIGPLQTNKVRQAVALFDVIETVDRPKLAQTLSQALAEETARTGRRPCCYVQVNTGAEPQKAGVLPRDADAFIEACREIWKLPVAGLMCIPPVDEEPALHFGFLREIGRRHGIDTLSMGMSDDYETAIRFGATHVRIGTALFGARASRTASPA